MSMTKSARRRRRRQKLNRFSKCVARREYERQTGLPSTPKGLTNHQWIAALVAAPALNPSLVRQIVEVAMHEPDNLHMTWFTGPGGWLLDKEEVCSILDAIGAN